MYAETPHAFCCGGEQLVGIITSPLRHTRRGVLFLVGGPQYRAGSHRQFTLLARALAGHAMPSMRFDVRGMGDSSGEPRGFEQTSSDIRAAADIFCRMHPVDEIVLWGLCDGASAAMLYAPQDARVRGMVLANPWVRTERSAAQATLRHYYRSRFLDAAFWKKIVAGDFRPSAALLSLAHLAAASRAPANGGLPERLLAALRRFDGKVLLILSGRDLTAQEFSDLSRSPDWRSALQERNAVLHRLEAANHTFSSAAWRGQVAQWTADWVKSW